MVVEVLLPLERNWEEDCIVYGDGWDVATGDRTPSTIYALQIPFIPISIELPATVIDNDQVGGNRKASDCYILLPKVLILTLTNLDWQKWGSPGEQLEMAEAPAEDDDAAEGEDAMPLMAELSEQLLLNYRHQQRWKKENCGGQINSHLAVSHNNHHPRGGGNHNNCGDERWNALHNCQAFGGESLAGEEEGEGAMEMQLQKVAVGMQPPLLFGITKTSEEQLRRCRRREQRIRAAQATTRRGSSVTSEAICRERRRDLETQNLIRRRLIELAAGKEEYDEEEEASPSATMLIDKAAAAEARIGKEPGCYSCGLAFGGFVGGVFVEFRCDLCGLKRMRHFK